MRIMLTLLFAVTTVMAEEDWPPKPVIGLKEKTSTLPTADEWKELDKLVAKYKLTEDSVDRNNFSAAANKISHKLVVGDKSTWSVKDYKERAELNAKLLGYYERMYKGANTRTGFWPNTYPEWVSYADGHAKFFERLLYGFEKQGCIKKSDRNSPLYKQAVLKYMDRNPKKFPDVNAKVKFCAQLVTAGVQDEGIKKLPIALIEEAKQ